MTGYDVACAIAFSAVFLAVVVLGLLVWTRDVRPR